MSIIGLGEIRPWRLTKCVLPQHTDHGGVMWHGAYLSWLEEARVEALAKAGLPYQQFFQDGFSLPVVSLDIKYSKALFHGEEVILESWSLPSTGIRWSLHTTFINTKGAKTASAKVDLVVVRATEQTQRIVRNPPHYFLEAMKILQSGP